MFTVSLSSKKRPAHDAARRAQGLLASWDVRSDPCDDAWAFVSCNCSETVPALAGADCAAANGGPAGRRVLALAVGGLDRTAGRQLVGPLDAALGGLSQLHTLDLHDNRLQARGPARGCLPPSAAADRTPFQGSQTAGRRRCRDARECCRARRPGPPRPRRRRGTAGRLSGVRGPAARRARCRTRWAT